MTRTPWGDADQLRARKLAPGLRLPPEVVARHQRNRLLAAMVASVSERGYEATSVAQLVELSGVSRTAFYKHFASKEECFVAVIDEVRTATVEAMWTAYRASGGGGRERLEAALRAAGDLVLDQAPTARVCFTELYAAGPTAIGHGFQMADAIGQMVRESLVDEGDGEAPPAPVVRGLVGGFHKVFYTHLRIGEEAELPALIPGLAEWATGYRPGTEPLRQPRSRAAERPPVAPPSGDAADRILFAFPTALVDTRYAELRLDEVVERARISFRTFYEHFESKEEAFLAAYELGTARTVAAVLPAFQRAPDWPRAVRDGLRAFISFFVAEPGWVQVGVVEALAAGPEAMARRDTAIAIFSGLLDPGFELSPKTPRVAADAIGGAIYSLIYENALRYGTRRLPELLPTLTLIALAPFVGVDAATELANERPGGRRKQP